MKRNAGTIDRVVRVVAGIAILALAFIGPKTPFGFIGIVPLLTGLIGWCPLYTVIGLNTCPIEKSDS